MTENKPSVFPQRMKKAREARGIKQEELAAAMELDQQQISRWETGANHPSDDVIFQIGKLLNVSADYLVGLTTELTEYVAGRQLTPMQARLLWALDEGHISIAHEALAALTKEKK